MKNIFHIHNFKKPVASQYRSFNGRNIIFECKCGKREMRFIYDFFGRGFPLETNILITDKEMEQILNEKSSFNYCEQVKKSTQ
jgi:hypothetical protein